MTTKRLFRSRKDRTISGIFGGLGDFFNVDSRLLRLAWIAITVFTGFIPGIIIYFFGIFVIPAEPK